MPGKGQARFFLLAAASVVVLDQLTKLWVRNNLALGTVIPKTSFLNLVYYANTGAVFGLFPGQVLAFIITTVAVMAGILVARHYLPPAATLSNVALGLLFGGATGNLIDRVCLNFVTDFIDVHWSQHHWSAFNFADASIVAGIILFIYSLYRLGFFARVYHHGLTTRE
jgi:signal peptidase II